jgi:hypothetical protein
VVHTRWVRQTTLLTRTSFNRVRAFGQHSPQLSAHVEQAQGSHAAGQQLPELHPQSTQAWQGSQATHGQPQSHAAATPKLARTNTLETTEVKAKRNIEKPS